jgi:riboflavin biosynthesis pyrimidine reductase
MLRERGISYIVAGESSVDLARAVELLAEQFGIRTLLLEGGGHINGGFLAADLVDEVSLLLLPGIDGRREIAAVFDGISADRQTATQLKLKSLEQRGHDTLWIRYEVVRHRHKRDESV